MGHLERPRQFLKGAEIVVVPLGGTGTLLVASQLEDLKMLRKLLFLFVKAGGDHLGVGFVEERLGRNGVLGGETHGLEISYGYIVFRFPVSNQ